MFSYFANPTRYHRLARILEPLLAVIGVPLLVYGLYLALVEIPPDYQQGESARILHIHVPAAMFAQGLYLSMAIAAAVALIWRHILADLYCRAAGPIGAVLTGLCLVTGSLWGYPTWGTWWEWDARMTSVLVLFFLYLGHILLVRSFDEPEQGDRLGAILLLVGVVNLPIIYFSVEWWNTLHQGRTISYFEEGGTTMDPAMLEPLPYTIIGIGLVTGWIVSVTLRAEIAARKVLGRERSLVAQSAF